MISMLASQEPTGKLGPEPWLTAPETVRVVTALQRDGADVRFVGGCVRDALAHKHVSDIDIGTPDLPDRVTALLAADGIKTVPTGIDHGTVTAVIDKRTFEITTLRRDVETDGRRAVVAYTDDWIVDSSRRDFTINALSATPNGDVYDYHNGIPDLAHGKVQFIGRADARIEEDHLRILRYFRFYGHYGRPPADVAAFNACRKHADKLHEISAERIRHEMLRILMSPDPADVFLLMKNAHVLDVVLPEAGNIGRLRATAWLSTRALVLDGLHADPIRRLGASLRADTDASAIGSRLRLSNRESDRLVKMTEIVHALREPLSENATQRLVHVHGGEAVADATILAWAERLAEVAKLPSDETAARRTMLEIALAWKSPTFPIDGKDAQALGLERGPQIGKVLRQVENWWAAGDFNADRDACLAQLQKAIQDIRTQKKPGNGR
jgi:poly(A) polymerase